MAFDVSRLRTDQLLRLNEVDYDLSKLGDDELVSIIIDSQEEYGALGSAFERVDASPVVPHGTNAELPCSICQSTRRRKAPSSNCPPRNGVTRAGIEPENIDFRPFLMA